MISLEGKVILVVDDEEGYREVLADEFALVGATVLAAENGTSALELFLKNKIDAVVSDVRMPNGNGVDFLDQVKAINSRTPVVMLITGYSDLSLEDAYDKGAEGIFSKPCNLDALVESVHRALHTEKERWVRDLVSLPTDFNVEIKAESMGAAIRTRVLNIGRGGMFIAFETPPINADTRVAFQMLPGGTDMTSFEGMGICRWLRHGSDPSLPDGMGIEFTDLTEQSLLLLQNLLNKLKPRAFIPKSVI